MMQLNLPSTPILGRAASWCLRVLLILWGLMCIAALWIMNLGTDEAWALNGLRSLLRPTVPDLTSELIPTNGGLFALMNIGIEATLGSRLWAHRLVSLLALALACCVVLRQVRTARDQRQARWIGLAVLVSVPGLAEVGTAALGTAVGLALMLTSMVLWTSPKHTVTTRAIGGGVLYGLAAASRFDLVLFGVAIMLCAFFRPVQSGRVQFRLDGWATLFVTIGISIFLVNQWLMGLSAQAMNQDELSVATGLSGGFSFNYPKLLNHWHVLLGFAPPVLLVAMMLSSLRGNEAIGEPVTAKTSVTIDGLLIVTGIVLLLAWLFRAPIPHLRYALPGLFCFAAVGSMGLQRCVVNCISKGNLHHLLICQCIGLACVFGAIPSLARSLIMSDSDNASWEWTHETSLDYFRRFDARQDQLKLVQYLQDEARADARVYSVLPFALRYLSEKPVVDLTRPSADAEEAVLPLGKRLLVLGPAVGTYFHLHTESATWLMLNATLETQIGRYSVYLLPSGMDRDLQNLKFSRSNYRAHPGSQPWFGRN
jgi:hypothetical protein